MHTTAENPKESPSLPALPSFPSLPSTRQESIELYRFSAPHRNSSSNKNKNNNSNNNNNPIVVVAGYIFLGLKLAPSGTCCCSLKVSRLKGTQ